MVSHHFLPFACFFDLDITTGNHQLGPPKGIVSEAIAVNKFVCMNSDLTTVEGLITTVKVHYSAWLYPLIGHSSRLLW